MLIFILYIQIKSENDQRNSGVELELQNIFSALKSALGDSELDSIIQTINAGDQQMFSKSGSKPSTMKKKMAHDQSGSPTKMKSISTSSKEGKAMLEEMKKVICCLLNFQ